MKNVFFLLVLTSPILFCLTACISVSPTLHVPEPEATESLVSVQPSPSPSIALPSEEDEPVHFDTSEWIDLGVINIPATLSYEEVGLHGEIMLTGDFLESHDSVWGDTWMFVGMLMGDFESLLKDSEKFTFDDGHVGIYTETFDLNTMGWIREDGNLVTLNHGGDTSMFTDNKDVILQIVSSLK
jgi:hypothetical protein